MIEASIEKERNILLVLPAAEGEGTEDIEKLAADFCGTVVSDLSTLPDLANKHVYLCGDLANSGGIELDAAERVFVIRELSQGYEGCKRWPIVDVGQVPILVHGVGVYYRRFFGAEDNLFKKITTEHAFQNLTESTKPGRAHRTGIYLTPVEPDGEDLHYRLLRCSSNLSGPTLDFRDADNYIVESLNREAACIFQNQAQLNHVLAQIYHNTPATGSEKQRKAAIKAHADKTKDMPDNGIMAFCTFYDNLDRLQPLATDPYDYGHKGVSGLTKLRFRLKKPVSERPGCNLTPHFTVTLYPGSAFFMPLSTNRLYTHEIRPAALNASLMPTRMGYVVRCSGTEAVHRDGQTNLKLDGEHVKLEPPTLEGMSELRKLYAEENSTDSFVDYGRDKFLFSMNRGDYAKPETYDKAEEFRVFEIPTKGKNLFEELMASVKFENVGKGRQGMVLVKPDEARGTPIVRTTTKYGAPAQCFQPIHERLAKEIQNIASLREHNFNNALIENYTDAYRTMGFHSDQALDLEDGSSIALFSCYSHPDLAMIKPRKLVVEPKGEPGDGGAGGGGTFEIPLNHNSVVIFSLDTNRRFRHKIVLDKTPDQQTENQWLGVTFRTSDTFVRYCEDNEEGGAFFEDGTALTTAAYAERTEFYEMRGLENRETDFVYPRLPYTVSESDLMPPRKGPIGSPSLAP